MVAITTDNAIPLSEATAHDFIQIRAALVRRLGSANAALVWSRVFYRANAGNPGAYDRDGFYWWRASRETVAAETGLTAGQSRRQLELLEESGALIIAKHHLDGKYDQTKSYRCNVVDPATHMSKWTNERSESPNEEWADPTDVDWSDSPNLSIKTSADGLKNQSSTHVTNAGAHGADDKIESYPQPPSTGVNLPEIQATMLRECGRPIDSMTAIHVVGIVLDRAPGRLVSPTRYVTAAIERDVFGWQNFVDQGKVPA
jgi:hypothetical protein